MSTQIWGTADFSMMFLPLHGGPGDQKELRSHRIHDKMVQESHWADALDQQDSDEAIQSFWRCKLIEIGSLCDLSEVPRESPFGPWKVPGVPSGVWGRLGDP